MFAKAGTQHSSSEREGDTPTLPGTRGHWSLEFSETHPHRVPRSYTHPPPNREQYLGYGAHTAFWRDTMTIHSQLEYSEGSYLINP